MIITRVATQADIEVVVELLCGFRDFLGEKEPDASTFRAGALKILNDGTGDFVLAGDGLGLAQLRYKFSAWTGGVVAEIEDLYVHENHRGQGVGMALVQGSIDRAKHMGSPRLSLDANERNLAAVKLYERFGFDCQNHAWWDGGRDLFFKLYF